MGCGGSTAAAASAPQEGPSATGAKGGAQDAASASKGGAKGGIKKMLNSVLDDASDVRDMYTFDKVSGRTMRSSMGCSSGMECLARAAEHQVA